MTIRLPLIVCVIATGWFAQAQPSTPLVTQHDVSVFATIFSKLDSTQKAPGIVEAEQKFLAQQFALTADELDVVLVVSKQYQDFLGQLREAQRAIISDKKSLSSADMLQLDDLLRTRDARIVSLAGQVFQKLRPETLAHLRTFADRVTTQPKR